MAKENNPQIMKVKNEIKSIKFFYSPTRSVKSQEN